MVRNKWYDTIMTDYNGRLPDVSVIEQLILSVPDEQTRIFCILSYLTGGRISEIVNYQQEQWIKRAKRGKKGETIKDEEGKTIYEWIKRPKTELLRHPGLLKSNIIKENIKLKDSHGEKIIEVLTITMRNEKHRKRHFKTIYAPYFFEKRLIDSLFEYLGNIEEKDIIINADRRKIYTLFRKNADSLYYPHFLRALRVGVLMEVYGFESFQIKEFMGWTDDRPFEAYYIFKKDQTMLRKYISKIEDIKI